MQDCFPENELYLFGGALRDRLFDNLHDERIKISDYDFLL